MLLLLLFGFIILTESFRSSHWPPVVRNPSTWYRNSKADDLCLKYPGPLRFTENDMIQADSPLDSGAIPSRNGAWMPFAVLNCIDEKDPTELEVVGETYVIWKNPLFPEDDPTRGWNIMKDACPHRLAPLSQGRVDQDTGCIECPYHGWQFESGTGEGFIYYL